MMKLNIKAFAGAFALWWGFGLFFQIGGTE